MSHRDDTPERGTPDAPAQPEHALPAGAERDPAKLLPPSADAAPMLPPGRETDATKLLTGHVEKIPTYPPHHPARHPKHTAKWLGGILFLAGLYAAGMAIHDGQQERDDRAALAHRMTGGDPEVGKGLIRAYGCPACHTIAGVPGANALVGPPLTGIASRVYIGGVLTNTPDHMVRWIMNPKAVDEKTAMPYLGVTREQARHIAAYLYTLQ